MAQNSISYYKPDWIYPSGIVTKDEQFSTRVTQCLDRYWEIVKYGKKQIEAKINKREMFAIASAMVSPAWSDRADCLNREILLNVMDSMPNELSLNELEHDLLIQKLKDMEYVEQVYLAEYLRDYQQEQHESKGK